MNSKDIERFRKIYINATIMVSPYTIKKINLVQSKTVLKVDNFYLATIPFSLSLKKAELLFVFSREESTILIQHKDTLSALHLTFHEPGAKKPTCFYIKGKFTSINHCRENVYKIEFVYRNCPDTLIGILGSYLDAYYFLQKLYLAYKDKPIEVNKDVKKELFLYNLISIINSKKIIPSLLSISTNRFMLLMPKSLLEIKKELEFSSTLFFAKFKIIIKGKINEIESYNNEYNKIYFDIPFNPQLVEILHTYKSKIKKNLSPF